MRAAHDSLDLDRRLNAPYQEWRRSRIVEVEAIRRLEEERNAEIGKGVAMILGAILFARAGGRGVSGAFAGIGVRMAVEAVKTASDDARIHQAGLTELGESFAADSQPIIFEVEGETVKLTGTSEEKFRQWREILAKLHEREVGPELSEPSDSRVPAGFEPPPLTN